MDSLQILYVLREFDKLSNSHERLDCTSWRKTWIEVSVSCPTKQLFNHSIVLCFYDDNIISILFSNGEINEITLFDFKAATFNILYQ